MLIAGVEGGGTKFLAAVARGSKDDAPPVVVERLRVDTTSDPSATLSPIATWLAGHAPDAVGIATFGPLDLAAGIVGPTPKPGWRGAAVRDLLTAGLDTTVPVGFDTDVNGAALAEWRWGSARGSEVVLYVTIGTGVGGGAVVRGEPIHGLGHPEMGHVTVARHLDDQAPGSCPHHSDCLEGRVSGTAITAVAGIPADRVAADHPIWDRVAYHLAHGLADLTLVLSPQVIVVGGGVSEHAGLFDRVAAGLDGALAGYVATPRLTRPAFGQEAGLFGALALAERAVDEGPASGS